LSKKSIRDLLKDFGLADNQAKIYIFLAKHGVLKGGEISKQTKIQKAVVYRTLKILQRKGFVESTLEFPARYTAVPFETVLDYNIKTKKEEALQIERSKTDLLNDWKNIARGTQESTIEKFTVIEGDRNIFAKIYQMIKQTKNQLYAASTISDLFRADRFGVFDAVYDHPLKSTVKFRFLTDLTNSDLSTIKLIKNRLRSDLDFRGRNPELGIALFPRMVMRDQEEVLLFISDKNKQTCLFTNCKSIIQSYSGVFEDLWQNSTNIKQKIEEIETGKSSIKTLIIKNPETAKKQHITALNSAKKEVMIITSSNGLSRLSKNTMILKKWSEKNVSIKVMAPIITEKLQVVQELMRYCEVRHIPLGYFETVIIDDNHLFQFRKQSTIQMDTVKSRNFENTFYTNDFEYIKQTKNMIQSIWRKTRVPSNIPIQAITRYSKNFIKFSTGKNIQRVMNKITLFKSFNNKLEKITEESVLQKFHNGKKYSIDNFSEKHPNNFVRYYGTTAFVLIRPPESFSLPNIILGLWQHNNRSSFGEDNLMHIYLCRDKLNQFSYELAAVIQNNPKAAKFRKAVFADMPVEQNVIVLPRDQFQIRVKGTTVFAIWTVPIPLIPSEYNLPPSSVLFEGYGDVRPELATTKFSTGRKYKVLCNCFEAFTTFYHPKSKYSSPGTEGYIDREFVLTSTL